MRAVDSKQLIGATQARYLELGIAAVILRLRSIDMTPRALTRRGARIAAILTG